MKIRTSELDGKTLVFEIECGDSGPLVDMLDGPKPNGFAVFGEGVEFPFAVVDGRNSKEKWFTSNHLLAVEAHELGHINMRSCEEKIAEREGIRLLQSAGHKVAAKILIERGIV